MVNYTLVRSRRRRRSVAMQVSRTGEVIVRAPIRMPKFFIDRFVQDHGEWIEKQLVERTTPRPKPKAHFPDISALESYLRAKVKEYGEITGLKPKRLRFKEVHTYWGSCSPDGTISFNHHLLYAPHEAVDYVVVHELCHLRYRGHGKRFWQLVEKYYPGANDMRKVLRQIHRE